MRNAVLSIPALLLLSLASGLAVAEESTIKEGAKQVGQETRQAAHKVAAGSKQVGKKVADTARDAGHATRDAAKTVGKKVAETAVEVGHATRDGAKEVAAAVKQGVTGKSTASDAPAHQHSN